MGERGPAPKPTSLRILEGNRSKRAVSRSEPLYAAGVPKAPRHMSAAAGRVWRELVPEMLGCRVLRRTDGRTLYELCELEALAEEFYTGLSRRLQRVKAERQRLAVATDVKAEDLGPGGPLDPLTALLDLMGTPEAKRSNTHLHRFCERLLTLRREFGLTPAARTRINTDLQDAPVDNLELNLCG